MKSSPYVSIFMPVYNADKYLKDSIESVLSQTYPNFEFIIVDNGSTDKSAEIIKIYAQKDKRIRPFFLKEKGLVKALNFAVHQAKYDWVMRMDADDVCLPEKLEVQLNYALKESDIAGFSCYGKYLSEDGKRILGNIKVGSTTKKEYLEKVKANKLMFTLDSTLMKKEVFYKVGGYRNLPVLEDLDLYCRIADLNEIVLTIPEPLIYYRKRRGSETAEKCILLNEVMKFIKYNMILRRSGKRELTLEEFRFLMKNRSWFSILDENRKILGSCIFKRAGIALSYGKYFDFIFNLILSGLIAPDYIVEKARMTL